MAASSVLSGFWNAALISFGFFMCFMVNFPMIYTPSEPKVLERITNSTSHAEVQGLVCRTEIGRLKAVVSELEAKYGYDELRRGIRHGGEKWRTTLLVQRLLSGEPLKVTMVGGSISAGNRMNPDPASGDKTYGQHLIDSLSILFPLQTEGANYKLLRATYGGCGSYIHQYCAFDIMRENHCTALGLTVIEQSMLTSWVGEGDVSRRNDASGCEAVSEAKNADLVLLDFAVNDYILIQPAARPDTRQAEEEVLRHQESVLRQMLALPSGALSMFVNFGFVTVSIPLLERSALTAQHLIDRLGAHYGVPSVSFLDTFGPIIGASNPIPNCTDQCYQNEYMWDLSHPTSQGHKLAADLILYLILTETISLMQVWQDRSVLKAESEVSQVGGGDGDEAGDGGDNTGNGVGTLSTPSGRRLLNERGVGEQVVMEGSEIDFVGVEVDGRRKLEDNYVREECFARDIPVERTAIPDPIHPRNKDKKPWCLMARDWKMQEIGGMWHFFSHQFITSYTSTTLSMKVDFGEYKSFGVVFMRSNRIQDNDNVLNISLGGEQVETLRMYWPSNKYVVWYIVEDIFKSDSLLGLKEVVISTAGQGFQIMALIAE